MASFCNYTTKKYDNIDVILQDHSVRLNSCSLLSWCQCLVHHISLNNQEIAQESIKHIYFPVMSSLQVPTNCNQGIWIKMQSFFKKDPIKTGHQPVWSYSQWSSMAVRVLMKNVLLKVNQHFTKLMQKSKSNSWKKEHMNLEISSLFSWFEFFSWYIFSSAHF